MKKGFTLVELMIVMAILSTLVGLIGSGFRSSQIRGRDAKRKSDLKQISAALELLVSDHGNYPNGDAAGKIEACPFDASGGTSSACSWGVGDMSDGKTLYLKKVPQDPASGISYFYRVPSGSNNQKFQIFAHLENTKDGDCLGGNCESPPQPNYNCGTKTCNFAVTSSNTDYSE